MTFASLLLGVVVVLLITLATGYFVAQEFAYMAVDRSRLRGRAESGDQSAARALAVTRRTSFMLSGAQLGITVTGLLVGYVAEPLIGESLGTMLGGVGIPTAVSVGIGAVLALLFSTVVQMVFGELFPKNLAIARAEAVALRLAASTTLYLKLMGWLISFFDHASNLVLKAARIEPVHDVEHAASARDLEHIVADSRESGDLPIELSVMLDRILDFPSRDVEHAMIPRARVDTVSDTDSLADVRRQMEHGHSRYPIIAEDTEMIVGVAHLADLLRATHPDDAPVAVIQRPALVIPTLMPLPDAVAQLNANDNQLACVVDEYGGFAGILTLEDLAEEIVGEITDEHDPDTGQPPQPDDGVWVMAGSVHVDEVERSLGVDLPRGDYETIAGLVIAQLGFLPEQGATIEVPLPPDPADLLRVGRNKPVTLVVEVSEVANHVPARVRLSLSRPPGRLAEDSPSAGEGGSE
ncbi:MAG: hemolysin family protein [Candidatus Nanopelagicales bacterium]